MGFQERNYSDDFTKHTKHKLIADEITFLSSAKYMGGIMNIPSKPEGLDGEMVISVNGDIYFKSSTFLSSNRKYIYIPIKKIKLIEITNESIDNTSKNNSTTAMSYFAGGAPISTYKFKMNVIKIPFIDENDISHTAIFSIKKQKLFDELNQIIYNLIVKHKKK